MKNRACLFNEVRPFETNLGADTLQALELDADFHAAAMSLLDIIGGTDPLDVVIRTDFDIETRIALLTFAMCSSAIFWHSETKKGLDDPVHPHPLTRAYTFLNSVFALAEKDELREMSEIIGRGVKRGMQGVFIYAAINPDYEDLARVADERTFRSEYKEIVVRKFELLERYAYWDRSYPVVPLV
jgi:hypothetical protein